MPCNQQEMSEQEVVHDTPSTHRLFSCGSSITTCIKRAFGYSRVDIQDDPSSDIIHLNNPTDEDILIPPLVLLLQAVVRDASLTTQVRNLAQLVDYRPAFVRLMASGSLDPLAKKWLVDNALDYGAMITTIKVLFIQYQI